MSDKLRNSASRQAAMTLAASVKRVQAGQLAASKPEATKVQDKASKASKVHQWSTFGHWSDSVRGILDNLLDTTEQAALTVAQLAAEASKLTLALGQPQVTEARVRQHLGDLQTQANGGWTHHHTDDTHTLTVRKANGKYWVTFVTYASADAKAKAETVQAK